VSEREQVRPGTAFPAQWSADDRALPPIPVAQATEPLAPDAAPRRSPWARLFGGALGLLASMVLGVWVYDWIAGLFARSSLLGWTGTGLLAAFAASMVALVARELNQMRRLAAVAELRERARARMEADTPGDGMAVIGAILRALPAQPDTAERVVQFRAMVHGALSDRQTLQLFDRSVLRPLDERAQAIIVRAARDAAVGVSISPLAVLDVVVTVWRSLRMIRDIAGLYGFRPGAAATLALARRLFVTATAAAAIDVAGTMWGEHLSGRVAGVLSAKLSEGIITAVRTARLGLATIEACRPLPFAEDQRPGLAQLGKQVLAGLSL
jgi:putative membrane protein